MRMLENEERLAGEFAVFYHSYSFAALLYEVQAAVAAVLFRFPLQLRLAAAPAQGAVRGRARRAGAAQAVQHQALKGSARPRPALSSRRHLRDDDAARPRPRGAADQRVSVRLLVRRPVVHGRARAAAHRLLAAQGEVSALAKKIIKLSEEAGLDVMQFGGKPCKSHRPGHLLQIFLKRELVDRFAYAAFPYGPQDKSRTPLSDTLAGNKAISGQVRICFNPSVFMRAGNARMFVYSADPTYHERRSAFRRSCARCSRRCSAHTTDACKRRWQFMAACCPTGSRPTIKRRRRMHCLTTHTSEAQGQPATSSKHGLSFANLTLSTPDNDTSTNCSPRQAAQSGQHRRHDDDDDDDYGLNAESQPAGVAAAGVSQR
jgi:hypothetical protein